MQQYFEAGGLSQQDFDNAEAAFRVAETDWDAVRQSVKVKAPIAGVLTRLNVRESDNVEEEDELFTVSSDGPPQEHGLGAGVGNSRDEGGLAGAGDLERR